MRKDKRQQVQLASVKRGQRKRRQEPLRYEAQAGGAVHSGHNRTAQAEPHIIGTRLHKRAKHACTQKCAHNLSMCGQCAESSSAAKQRTAQKAGNAQIVDKRL
jgi:hypothetical protein